MSTTRTFGVWSAWLLLAMLVACGGPQERPNRIHGGGLSPPSEAPSRTFPRERDALQSTDLLGEASWYGGRFHGRTTANGERFDMYGFTAAHRTLPFNTIVRVYRADDRRNVVVRINDRGPGSPERVIDLSYAAAYEIDLIGPGHLPVELEIIRWGDGAVYED